MTSPTASLIPPLRETRARLRTRNDAVCGEIDKIIAKAKAENRNTMHASEKRRFDDLVAESRELGGQLAEVAGRIDEVTDLATRQGEANEARKSVGGFHVTSEAGPYRRDARPEDPSFFLDLRNARMGDSGAMERLNRTHVASMETRAGDMSTTAGQGGQFAPPLWLVEDFVALARPGRTTANLYHHETLPSGISSINLPAVSGGSTTAVQATQNSSVSDTAMTTTSVSSGITTVAGKQVVSMQLLQQSGIPFDRVILGDLAADYAKQLNSQVLYGSNASGQLNGLVNVANAVAYTSAAPAFISVTNANSFYNRVLGASATVNTTRFMPPDSVVMHPNRWAWALEALDGVNRPQITAGSPTTGYNVPAVSTEIRAEGAVGTLAGLDVFVDPLISLTANSTTNQDECYVVRREDLYLWETQPLLESFDSTYADQLSVLYRCVGWSAAIPHRYTASVQAIRGTGMVLPTL